MDKQDKLLDKVSMKTNVSKPVREAHVDKIVSVIKNNQVPTNIDKIV